jgi:hypothetical protein
MSSGELQESIAVVAADAAKTLLQFSNLTGTRSRAELQKSSGKLHCQAN